MNKKTSKKTLEQLVDETNKIKDNIINVLETHKKNIDTLQVFYTNQLQIQTTYLQDLEKKLNNPKTTIKFIKKEYKKTQDKIKKIHENIDKINKKTNEKMNQINYLKQKSENLNKLKEEITNLTTELKNNNGPEKIKEIKEKTKEMLEISKIFADLAKELKEKLKSSDRTMLEKITKYMPTLPVRFSFFNKQPNTTTEHTSAVAISKDPENKIQTTRRLKKP